MSPHDKPEAQQFEVARLAERYDGVRSTRMPEATPALIVALDGFSRRRALRPALALSDAAFEALVDAWFAREDDPDDDPDADADAPAPRERLSARQLGVGPSFCNW